MHTSVLNQKGDKGKIAKLTLNGAKTVPNGTISVPALPCISKTVSHDNVVNNNKIKESMVQQGSHIKKDENSQGIGNITGSDVVGNNVNRQSCQENHVKENSGITGISGTKHNITINQCPQEIIDLIIKFIKSQTP